MENKRIILGLDVSTTTIGCCLMTFENGIEKIIKLTHISPKVSSKIKGVESLFLKRKIFEDEFISNYKDLGITDVVIEEPLLGSNNVYTVATLLKFNGMISDSIYRLLGIVPEYISSHDARAYGFPELMAVRVFNKKNERYPIKTIKKSLKDNKLVLFGSYLWDIGKKDVILDRVSNKFPNIEWIYDKNGELKKENFDSSDSVVCCLGYINRKLFGDLKTNISEINEQSDNIEYIVDIWGKKYIHKIELNNEF